MQTLLKVPKSLILYTSGNPKMKLALAAVVFTLALVLINVEDGEATPAADLSMRRAAPLADPSPRAASEEDLR